PLGRAHAARATTGGARHQAHQQEFHRAGARRGGRQGAREGAGVARPAAGAGRQAQVAGLLLTTLLGGGACASQGDPPGGPPRSAIHVSPREGWKRGRVYHLQVLPGIADLRRNATKTGTTVVFTTGPAVPAATLTGTVLLWAEQRTLPQAVIRAALLPDTIAYV